MTAPTAEVDPDADLVAMAPDVLLAAAPAVRAAIRARRDASGPDLCWHHPGLWALLPEARDKSPEAPEWPAFIQGRAVYRAPLDREGTHQPRRRATFHQGEAP